MRGDKYKACNLISLSSYTILNYIFFFDALLLNRVDIANQRLIVHRASDLLNYYWESPDYESIDVACSKTGNNVFR